MTDNDSGDDSTPVRRPISRRRALKLGAGGLGVGGLIAWLGRDSIVRWGFSRTTNDVAVTTQSPGTSVCSLTPEQIEGPYYIQSPVRSEISEGLVGKPLAIDIEIVSLPDCAPLPGATAEIWHCDAEGNYSGYEEGVGHEAFDTFVTLLLADSDHLDPVNDARYLRGAQVSDDDGRLQFTTIFPGWYDPRATHIHLKVSVAGQPYLTTQLYFPDELVDRIYRDDDRYSPFGECPYDLTTDFVIGDLEDGTGLLLDPVESGDELRASLRVGVTAA